MNKKQSKRKINLKSAILLLLLLAILLTASTYAWFTANRTVTVDDIDVNIAAQNGLQISANGVDWKSILKLEDLKAGYTSPNGTADTNQLPTTMEPVSTAGNVTNGKMEMFYGSVDPVDGEYALTATEQTDTKGENGKYVAFDIFLKVNQDEDNVILGENSHVVFKDQTTDRGIQNAARVAFLLEGNSDENAGQDTFVGQNSAVSFGTDAQETTYIWEPNSDVHTQSAVTYGQGTYKMGVTSHPEGSKITITQTDCAVIPAYGINKKIDTGIKLINSFYGKDFDNGNTDIDSFTKVTPSYSTKAAMTAQENAFSLKKGVTKMRVYMWIEGQDVDCENSASGSDATFKVEFRLPEGQ